MVGVLIDLKTAVLRPRYDADDLEWIQSNARLKYYYCRQKALGWPNMIWSKAVKIIWQRELSAADYENLTAHPRDRDLTAEAYKALVGTVLESVENGSMDCSCVEAFDDIRIALDAMLF